MQSHSSSQGWPKKGIRLISFFFFGFLVFVVFLHFFPSQTMIEGEGEREKEDEEEDEVEEEERSQTTSASGCGRGERAWCASHSFPSPHGECPHHQGRVVAAVAAADERAREGARRWGRKPLACPGSLQPEPTSASA